MEPANPIPLIDANTCRKLLNPPAIEQLKLKLDLPITVRINSSGYRPASSEELILVLALADKLAVTNVPDLSYFNIEGLRLPQAVTHIIRSGRLFRFVYQLFPIPAWITILLQKFNESSVLPVPDVREIATYYLVKALTSQPNLKPSLRELGLGPYLKSAPLSPATLVDRQLGEGIIASKMPVLARALNMEKLMSSLELAEIKDHAGKLYEWIQTHNTPEVREVIREMGCEQLFESNRPIVPVLPVTTFVAPPAIPSPPRNSTSQAIQAGILLRDSSPRANIMAGPTGWTKPQGEASTLTGPTGPSSTVTARIGPQVANPIKASQASKPSSELQLLSSSLGGMIAVSEQLRNDQAIPKSPPYTRKPKSETPKCPICMDRDQSKLAVIPCLHTGICKDCLAAVKKCPICRVEIVEVKAVVFVADDG